MTAGLGNAHDVQYVGALTRAMDKLQSLLPVIWRDPDAAYRRFRTYTAEHGVEDALQYLAMQPHVFGELKMSGFWIFADTSAAFRKAGIPYLMVACR